MNVVVKGNSGLTFVDVLISLTIVMTIAFGISTLFLETQRSQIGLTADSTRVALITSLRFNSENAQALKQTALLSSDLRSCLCGTSSCKENQVIALQLRDIRGKLISGTSSAPRRYDITGNACQSSDCAFEVTSTFECRGAQCGTSQFLHGDPTGRIIYQIRTLSSNNRALRNLKNVIVGVPVDFSMRTLRLYANDLCN